MPSFYDSEVEEQKRTGKVTNIALPILAALEAIGTSIATKGRNPSSHTLGIYKDVQSGREAALERALGRDTAKRADDLRTAESARAAKRLGMEEAEFQARENALHRAVVDKDKAASLLKGIEPLYDEATNTYTAGRKPKSAAEVQMEIDPLGWIAQSIKPPPTQVVLGGDGTYQAVVKTTGKTPDGKTVTAPPKPAAGTGTPKAPSGYRYTADGTMEAIPGGPADPKTKVDTKPPTEDQSKAGNFARRMELAMSDIAELEAGGYDRASSESAARSSRFTPNILNTKEGQRYSNAERNFASANLRKESGAVITPDEMRQQEELYFPRHGDTPETIAQKARNRAQAFEGMKAVAGPLFDRIPSMVPPKASSTGTVWRRAKDGKEYEYDANTKQPTGRSR